MALSSTKLQIKGISFHIKIGKFTVAIQEPVEQQAITMNLVMIIQHQSY